MPTTDPRELRVLKDLQAALRTMSTARGDGFTLRADSVVLDPVNIFDVPDTRLPFVILEPTDAGERRYDPAHQLTDEFEWVMTCRLDAKGDDPDRRYTLGMRFHADLERVVMRDVERGGLSADTRLRKPQVFTSMSGEQAVIVVQRGTCKLHRTFGEPA